MKRILPLAGLGLVVGLVLAASVAATPDSSATVRFGHPSAGSPFPPPDGHDASSNAKDNLIPRTVVIARGGSVTYAIDGFHQPVVYQAGTTPGDIAVPAFPPNLFVTPPDVLTPDQIAKGPVNEPPATQSWTPPAFTEAGRYLVICNLTPHFGFFNMYGWVIVK